MFYTIARHTLVPLPFSIFSSLSISLWQQTNFAYIHTHWNRYTLYRCTPIHIYCDTMFMRCWMARSSMCRSIFFLLSSSAVIFILEYKLQYFHADRTKIKMNWKIEAPDSNRRWISVFDSRLEVRSSTLNLIVCYYLHATKWTNTTIYFYILCMSHVWVYPGITTTICDIRSLTARTFRLSYLN